MIELDLQIACHHDTIPSQQDFQQWLEHSLSGHQKKAEITIRVVDKQESQNLNRHYRQQDKPTNVLSFPAEVPDYIDSYLLGDLIICAPIVAQEAMEQGKTTMAHWAHMVIHGTLHLLGYDHVNDNDAEAMENLEITLLSALGIPSPY